MDEKTFTGEGLEADEELWLFKEDAPQEVLDLRKELGAARGWTDEKWHDDVYKRKELFNELSNNHTALLDKLEEAKDNYAQLDALKEVVQAVNPEDEAKQTETETKPQQPVAPAPPTARSAPTEAPKKVSVFAKKQEAQSTVDPDQAGQPQASAPATESAAPPKPSMFARKEQAPETSPDPAKVDNVTEKRAADEQKAEDPPAKPGFFGKKPAATADAPEAPKPAAETAKSAEAQKAVEEQKATGSVQGGAVDIESLEAELRDRHGDEYEQKLAAAHEEIEQQIAAHLGAE